MDKLLEEKHRAIRRSVRRFCDRELRPIAAQIDQEARFPWEVAEKWVPWAISASRFPKHWAAPAWTQSVMPSPSRKSHGSAPPSAFASLSTTVWPSTPSWPLAARRRSNAGYRRWPGGKKSGPSVSPNPMPAPMPAASKPRPWPTAMNYVVNANKVFVTNGGVADVCLIFCRTDPDSRPARHQRGGGSSVGRPALWWENWKIFAACGPTRSAPSGSPIAVCPRKICWPAKAWA